MPEPEHVDTTAITAGRGSIGRSLAPVLYPSTTYTVDEVAEHAAMVGDRGTTGFYSRFASPGVRDFEDAVAALEGAEAAHRVVVGHGLGVGGDPRALLAGRPRGGHAPAVLGDLRAVHVPPAALRHRRHLRRRHRRRRHRGRGDPGPHAGGVRRDAGQPGAVARRPRRRRRHRRADHRRRLDLRRPRRAAPARPRRRPGPARRHQGDRRPQRQPARRGGRQRRPHRADLGVPVGARHPGLTVRRLERRARHPHARRCGPDSSRPPRSRWPARWRRTRGSARSRTRSSRATRSTSWPSGR